MMIKDPWLQAVGCPAEKVELWKPELSAAMIAYTINNFKRIAAFLAQIGHESGGFRYVRELWGPTSQQLRYERDPKGAWPPTAADRSNQLAYNLGNSEPGDGSRYRGRGLIQTTGRKNYEIVGTRLGLDTVNTPALLEQPSYAALSAADFWDRRALNLLADGDDFEGITRRINGGLNGLTDRIARWTAVKDAMMVWDESPLKVRHV